MAIMQRLGPWGYGVFFTILVPALLMLWARNLDGSEMVFWPVPFQPWAGWMASIFGGGLMVVSMIALWVIGKGMPMNAYPPRYFVRQATYAVFAHPIYAGFVCMVVGVSIITCSSAGFWVVTPIVLLMTLALVLGYEGPRLHERFSNEIMSSPFLSLPEKNDTCASWVRRLSACILALCPWALGYSVFSMMPSPQGAEELRMQWKFGIPTADWMVLMYSFAYPLAVAGPLFLRTNAQLRHYVIAAWLATLIGFFVMLVMPGYSSLQPVSDQGRFSWLLDLNRTLDAEWLALPSFHAVWTVLAVYCFQTRFAGTRLILFLWGVAALICVSCVMTGSHAIADVLSGILLAVLCWHYEKLWLGLVSGAEKWSNSWSAMQMGAVRIINHLYWSAIAAASGLLVVEWLAGPQLVFGVAWVFCWGLVTAAVWGYWLEGGERLSRPFGYYGFLLGAIVALALLAWVDISAAQSLMAAFACGAPLAQMIGRLRCLVQGCCHGKPVCHAPGIRVLHPKSRVTALSHLHGVSIHPTQLYSMVGNFVIFILLCRLWYSGATAAFIGGLYLILSSLARFVEEQYRGELQTPSMSGLTVYQWLAVLMLIVGIIVSMLDSAVVEAASVVDGTGFLLAAVAGLFAGVCMSIDFPSSQRRFSRLTVSDVCQREDQEPLSQFGRKNRCHLSEE